MQGITQLAKGVIEIDGEKYHHYMYNGKYKSKKWIVWDDVHYYNHGGLVIEE